MKVKYGLRKFFKQGKFMARLGFILIVLVGLFVGLDLGTTINRLLSEATGKKAEIIVDTSLDFEPMNRFFYNFAQGGEESDGMLKPTVSLMSQLKPEYVRLDHIYDYYEVVKKENGQLRFDFSKLDKEVEAVLEMGAKPFLALSYMPAGLGGGTVEKPDNWYDWQKLVQATIEHYSGKENKNIDQVYYEVWNEPDLFGDFKTYGDKNYLDMYRASVKGSGVAKNVNQFRIGGPATTGFYPAWTKALLKLSREENLRLDFISWHRYSSRVESFRHDLDQIKLLENDYPELGLKEKIITEWGPDPENNSAYDNQIGAAHMMAGISQMANGTDKAFLFEIKDGKDPNNQVFWGRYGLLTHEEVSLQVKPRFNLLKWIDLGGRQVRLVGEGSWVKGLASKDNQTVKVYLVNYDSFNSHYETVPVIIKILDPGKYQVIKEVFNGSSSQSEVTITQGTWTGQVAMHPNQIVRLILKRSR